jgi:hypothetical protein
MYISPIVLDNDNDNDSDDHGTSKFKLLTVQVWVSVLQYDV